MQSKILFQKPGLHSRRTGGDRRQRRHSDYRGPERRVAGERRTRTESRRHRRYPIRELFFVKLKSDSDMNLGQLVDISKGGMAIRCFSERRPVETYKQLDLFLSGGGYRIDQIPFLPVSSQNFVKTSAFNVSAYKRYGLKFHSLDGSLQGKLNYFIENFAKA